MANEGHAGVALVAHADLARLLACAMRLTGTTCGSLRHPEKPHRVKDVGPYDEEEDDGHDAVGS